MDTEDIGRMCIVYDDSSAPSEATRAIFHSDGRAKCYHSNRNIWWDFNHTSMTQSLREHSVWCSVAGWTWINQSVSVWSRMVESCGNGPGAASAAFLPSWILFTWTSTKGLNSKSLGGIKYTSPSKHVVKMWSSVWVAALVKFFNLPL